MKSLGVAIAGLGTIGGAVFQKLTHPSPALKADLGCEIAVKAVSARKNRFDLKSDFKGAIDFEPDAIALARRDDVDIIIELIGGEDGVAHALVEEAFQKGKHVITANKALLAKSGIAFAKMAEQAGKALNYEAAIAGSIPIVKILRERKTGEAINHICGILNGTSNYILCLMEKERLDFQSALARAQKQGYAEADPRFDINGQDAAHKLISLTRLAFGTDLTDIPVKGIEAIEILDLELAQDMGYAIRLIAHTQRHDFGVESYVRPALVKLNTPFARSKGTDNVIIVQAGAVNLCLEGAGAGAEPTAMSVISDIIDIARGRVFPPFGVASADLTTMKSKDYQKGESARLSNFYIRLKALDRAGSMAEITQIMARYDISLASVSQKDMVIDGVTPIALTTHATSFEHIDKAMAAFAQSEALTDQALLLKIENTDFLNPS